MQKKIVMGLCLMGFIGGGVMPVYAATVKAAADASICFLTNPNQPAATEMNNWLSQKEAEAVDRQEWNAQQVHHKYKKKRSSSRQRTNRTEAYLESRAWSRIAEGKPVFIFHTSDYRWEFWNNEDKLGSGVANGGKGYCRDLGRSCRTPVGEFTLYRKGGGWGCVSSKFPVNRSKARSKMPFCQFFKGGYAIHGSNYIHPSRHGSHGCIRVKTGKAKWLYSVMPRGTKVFVMPY